MRDRLMELLKGAETKVKEMLSQPLELDEWLGVYADHLLANGVIVPPCKVGYPVYRICKQRYPVDEYRMYWEDDWVILKRPFDLSMIQEIGKTVFLTREEAEQALKGEHHAQIH